MKLLLAICAVTLGILFFPGKADAAAYEFSYVSQTAPDTVNPGQHKTAKLSIKNTGTLPWQFTGPNAVRLGTSHVQNRGSGFQDGWFSSNRIALTRNLTNPSNTVTIQPNEMGEFEWTISPTLQGDDMGGTYQEYFQPVVENITWMQDIGIYWNWTVPAKVMVNFFTWYGPGETRWGGVIDQPPGGHYDSLNTEHTRQQLTDMQSAGLNPLFDWWETLPGNPQDTEHHHQAVINAINLIHAEFPSMKYGFMVEPTVQNNITPIPQGFYDTIYTLYGNDPQYIRYHGKPLMTCYLFRTCIGQDSRFSGLQFSGAQGYSYPTLLLWHYPYQDVQGDVTSTFGRFDNYYCGCAPVQRYNVTLQEPLLDNQMSFQGARKNTTRLWFHYGWNELYERANLEPHHNPDSPVSDTYQLDKMRNFLTNVWRVN